MLTIVVMVIGVKPWTVILNLLDQQSLADGAIQAEAMNLVNRVSII